MTAPGLDAAITRWWDRFDAAAETGAAAVWPRGDLLRRDLQLAGAGARVSPNGACHLLPASDGWLALNLARDDDRHAVPAWLESEVDPSDLDAIGARTRSRSVAHWRERAALLQMPVGIAGEARSVRPILRHRGGDVKGRAVAGTHVLDLSALWAGPLCGALLAAAGASVIRVEDPARPDPTGTSAPGHAARLNQGKRLIRKPVSADRLRDMLDGCDILITSARPAALARRGFVPAEVLRDYPRLRWIAITAHGWCEPAGSRVGFGDDCAIAGGLMARVGDEPRFLGDALADPLTGLVAAVAAAEAIREGRTGLLDCGLAPTAALFAAERAQ